MFQIIHIGIGNMIFDMTVLAHLRPIPVLQHNIGTGEGIFDLPSHRILRFTDDIVRSGMNLAGVLGQRGFQRHQGLILLIFHLDQLQRILQDKAIFGYHDGDFITPVADMLRQQQAILHILVSRVQRIRVTGSGKFGWGHILIGIHRFNTG